MSGPKCDIGVIGLGNMGRNLALNLADKGFKVAVYNRSPDKTEQFMSREAGERDISPARGPEELAELLARPRAALLMVSAGKAVDAVIEDLAPLLDQDDLIIDGGNSHFSDTERRAGELEKLGLNFLGMGISGGEEGARLGPSLMPGGQRAAYERVAPLLAKAAAQVDGEPCVAYLGRGSAGHYVKMVHNGIEYAFMQLIAESYDLLHRGLGLEPPELNALYHEWNQGELGGYLMEITAEIFKVKDPDTGAYLVDMIRDRAKQKGTGKWTTDDALELQSPTPAIDSAVMMRNLSTQGGLRSGLHQALGSATALDLAPAVFAPLLKDALYAGLILAFSQGLSLLARASEHYGYGLDLEQVCRIWRGGCIIRARLLERLRRAYGDRPGLESLLLDPELGPEVMARAQGLRAVVAAAAAAGLPAPGLMASLGYLDAMRSARLPFNLVQAQRDFFGGHTFERVDRDGVFHHLWQE
ncbi:MAG: NADP-dependent phosphogluconate dehydrogenase [Desulfarculaceae bacterium]|nr:NADP-dependent phosphogluconate dehydrogenase [Desulfarculaceae bacterium]